MSFRLLAIKGQAPSFQGPFLLLSVLTLWAKISWVDEDSAPRAGNLMTSEDLSLLKTKTKSPDEQNVLYSDKPTQCL